MEVSWRNSNCKNILTYANYKPLIRRVKGATLTTLPQRGQLKSSWDVGKTGLRSLWQGFTGKELNKKNVFHLKKSFFLWILIEKEIILSKKEIKLELVILKVNMCIHRRKYYLILLIQRTYFFFLSRKKYGRRDEFCKVLSSKGVSITDSRASLRS